MGSQVNFSVVVVLLLLLFCCFLVFFVCFFFGVGVGGVGGGGVLRNTPPFLHPHSVGADLLLLVFSF